ncbi:hypothetical protein Ahia01_001329900, partial [Argonauta hians]
GPQREGCLDDAIESVTRLRRRRRTSTLTQDRVRLTPTPRKVMRRRTGLASSEHQMKLCATIVSAVCTNITLDTATLQRSFGRTRIFLTQQQFDQLELSRQSALHSKACVIQRLWRLYSDRKRRRR